MEVGEKLKAIRRQLGLSQKGLSYRIKLSRGYIAELESGCKKPSKNVNRKINWYYRRYCSKSEPLVEVMTPEKPKKNWFVRLIKWFWSK